MSTSIESATNINEWIQSIKIRSGIRSKVAVHSSPCLQTLKVDLILTAVRRSISSCKLRALRENIPHSIKAYFDMNGKERLFENRKVFQSRNRSCKDLNCKDQISWRAFICKLVMACATNLIIKKDCRESLSAQKEHQRWRTHSVLVLMRTKENQTQVRNFWCINWMGEWKPRRSWAESWEFLIRRIDEMCKVIIF